MAASDDVRFWDKTAKKYAASKIADQGGYERTLERTQSFIAPTHSVLELGCGTGTTALRLAGSAGAYLATDIAGRMVGIANEKLARQPKPNLSFRQATAEELVGEGESFDVILGFSYLHLTQDPHGTLRAIGRLLRPNGLFISKTPCVGEMNGLIKHIMLPAMRAVGKAPHVCIFNAQQLVEMIAGEKFTIIANERHATKGADTRPFIVARAP